MKYFESSRLFIDDERYPTDNSHIVRSSAEACAFVELNGIPVFISFDHDLGGDDTSMKFIHWLVDYMMDTGEKFPVGFDYYVHSQNPVGRDNIKSYMDNMIRHFSQ